MKLSIIVPVYNVEPYLHRCVDSILNQTFCDFELILVDDGSPDKCGRICDEYETLDSRVRVIHKKNGGLSDARNAGLDIACGEFVGFVDSDDSISSRMYDRLIYMAECYGAEIAVCGILNLNQAGDVVGKWPNLTEDQIYYRNDFISHFFPDVRRNIMPSVANKIFRRELFSNVRFPLGKIYEDAQIQLQLYDQCQTIAVCHEHLYNYFYNRPGSINNTVYSERQFDLIDFSLSNYNFFLERKEEEQQLFALQMYTNYYMKNFYKVYIENWELRPQFLPYKTQFKRLLPTILRNIQICRMKKLAIIMMYINIKVSYRLSQKLFPECIFE